MSNFLSQSWLIDRRHALRAMGTCISLPIAGMHGPAQRGRAATATPRRSAFIYLANGVHSLNYQITTPGKDYEFSRSLKPLEKHRDVITPVSGLHHPGSLGHHHNCIYDLADRRKARPFGPQYHLRGPEDGRSHRAAHPLPVDGDRHHAGVARLDRGRRPAPRDASLQ